MGLKLNRKAYDWNKKLWHQNFTGELHHIYNHHAVSLCCLRLFVPAKPGHQDDWEWVGNLRVERRQDYIDAIENYHKMFGCRLKIFKADRKLPALGCDECYFYTEKFMKENKEI